MGTNILNDIDDAAKRKGRFDKKFPIYKPDLISRAGILLYRLSQTKEFNEITKSKADFNKMCRRLIEVIAKTIGEPADQISKFFMIDKKDNGEKKAAGALKYILNQDNLPEELNKKAKDKFEAFKEEINRTEPDKDEKEGEQRNWLIEYENIFVKSFEQIDTEIGNCSEKDEVINLLKDCLGNKQE